jgi:hypothetical protein
MSCYIPPALWSDRTVETIFWAGVDLGLPRRSDSGKSRLGPVSREAGRLEEKHASSFCPARFHGAAVFFAEGEKRNERYEHV